MSSISWFYLIIAGFFEIGWSLGLKLATTPSFKILGLIISVISMTASGILLWFSLKDISIGTAYAVWTGIGAAGTFIIGVLFFNDPSIIFRWIGVSLIILGVIFLKVA